MMINNPVFTHEEVLELFNYERRLFEGSLSQLTKAQLIETIEENEKNFTIGLDELYMRKRMTAQPQ